MTDSDSPTRGFAPRIAPPPRGLPGRVHLLVIGIDAYAHVPPLKNAVRDVRDFVQILTDYYVFAESPAPVVLLNEDATRDAIENALVDLADLAEPDDSVIIYFSGHGHTHLGRGHWVPVDWQVKPRLRNLLRNASIKDSIDAIRARHKVVISDSCFSGSLAKSTEPAPRGHGLKYMLQAYQHDSCMLLSSGRDELVSDGRAGENSPFAYALLSQLRSNIQEYLLFSDVAQWVKKETSNLASQTPYFGPMAGVRGSAGEFVLFRARSDGGPVVALTEAIAESSGGQDGSNAGEPARSAGPALSAEEQEMLRIFREMKTGVAPSSVGTQSPGAGVKKVAEAAYAEMKRIEGTAEAANGVQLGGETIGRVEILLKRAVLLMSEAQEMLLAVATSGVDGGFGSALDAFDEDVHHEKLAEAYRMLKEAEAIEPTNAEVLLQQAKVLIELTPDDPTDEERVLRRVQALLESPRNDAERFLAAQATFLLATTREMPHVEMLRVARREFVALRREEWVNQCDLLMAPDPGDGLAMNPYGRPSWNPTYPGAPSMGPGANAAATWQIPTSPQELVGRWRVDVGDMMQSVMHLTLEASGTFEIIQQVNVPGYQGFNAVGRWAYEPGHRTLGLQGIVNGIQPSTIGCMFVQATQGALHAVGGDGLMYTFRRVG